MRNPPARRRAARRSPSPTTTPSTCCASPTRPPGASAGSTLARAGSPPRPEGSTAKSPPPRKPASMIFHRSALTADLAAASQGEGSRHCGRAPAARQPPTQTLARLMLRSPAQNTQIRAICRRSCQDQTDVQRRLGACSPQASPSLSVTLFAGPDSRLSTRLETPSHRLFAASEGNGLAASVTSPDWRALRG
jgi:hypothetical protein